MTTRHWWINSRRDGKKPLHSCLQKVYGVGPAQATQACARAGLLPTRPFGKVSAEGRNRLSAWRAAQEAESQDRDPFLRVGEEGRQRVARNVARKIRSGSVQGIRRRRGLPTRGQRTHTNGQTARRLNKGRSSGF